MDICRLKHAHGQPGELCDGESCPFWRVVGHLGLADGEPNGCAIRHFELLGEEGSEVTEWLLSVKARLESQLAESPTDAADSARDPYPPTPAL